MKPYLHTACILYTPEWNLTFTQPVYCTHQNGQNETLPSHSLYTVHTRMVRNRNLTFTQPVYCTHQNGQNETLPSHSLYTVHTRMVRPAVARTFIMSKTFSCSSFFLWHPVKITVPYVHVFLVTFVDIHNQLKIYISDSSCPKDLCSKKFLVKSGNAQLPGISSLSALKLWPKLPMMDKLLQKTVLQIIYGFAPQFRTKVARVRFWIKESWRLWFGIWVLYFHRMLNITYWVLGVDWPLTLNAKIGGHVTWVICD